MKLWSKTAVMVSIFFVTAVPGAVRAEDGREDVKKSWDEAQVFLPKRLWAVTPAEVAVERPLPVVIYLHGCTGITGHDTSWGRYLAELGFIAVLPDSMARPRPSNCDPKTKKGGFFPQAHAMRQEEIRFARDQVKKSPWADPENVFLMGHSEGGIAVSRTKLDGFRGIVISGWRCTNRKFPKFDGIFAPVDTPVLTLEWEHDDWTNEVTKGSCAEKFGARKNARQVLFPGSGHADFDRDEAREAVSRFLSDNIAAKKAKTERPAANR